MGFSALMRMRSLHAPRSPTMTSLYPPFPTAAVSLVASEGDERLPRSSTCFNHLFLPTYSSAAVLEARLQQAITGAHAFDEGAPHSCALPCCAVIRCAVLCCALLRCAVLCSAALCCAWHAACISR